VPIVEKRNSLTRETKKGKLSRVRTKPFLNEVYETARQGSGKGGLQKKKKEILHSPQEEVVRTRRRGCLREANKGEKKEPIRNFGDFQAQWLLEENRAERRLVMGNIRPANKKKKPFG